MSGDLVTLVDSSNHLRNMQRKLSLVQRQSTSVPQLNPLPPVIDDRMGFTFTKVRKSMAPPHAFNKFRSEVYPVAKPPVHQFVVGSNSRLQGRDPVVHWK